VRSRGAETRSGMRACTQHPPARTGGLPADPPSAMPAPKGVTPGPTDAPAELGAVALPTGASRRAKGPEREHSSGKVGHTAAFLTCHSYVGVRRGKTLGKGQFRATGVLREFVGQSRVHCYYEPQGAKPFLLPNLVAVEL